MKSDSDINLFLYNLETTSGVTMGRKKQLCDFNDAELIEGIKESSNEVYTLLYSHYFQGLSMSALKYVKSTHVAEGIVQDIFLKMWEEPFAFNSIKALKPYLYRSVINASINHINREKNINKHHLKIAEDITDSYIDTVQEEQELKIIIYNEIEKLPEQCRKVFKMSRFKGMSYKEISSELNIAEKTVENHILKALRILRSNLLLDSSKKEYLDNIKYLTLAALLLSHTPRFGFNIHS